MKFIMGTTFPDTRIKKIHYAPINELYHESVAANITIGAMGPLHPGASFTLFGSVSLNADRHLKISATALTQITQFAKRVTFQVTARVMKKGIIVCPAQTLKQHYDAYIHNLNSIVIGEAFFVLPEPTDSNNIALFFEGTYLANFDEGVNAPRNLFGIGPAYIKKFFIINVVEDMQ